MPDNTTLYTTADAYVTETSPGNNAGSSSSIRALSRLNGNMRSFLKFDLSALPAEVSISLAKLRAYCSSLQLLIAGITDVEARRVADDSWTELGITWTNQKAYGIVEDTKVPAAGWVEWDVTSFIQAEYAGDKTASICLKSKVESYDGSYRQSIYRSRDYDSLDPELYIEYTVPITHELAGVITGIASVAGAVLMTRGLAGAAAGVCSAVANLTRIKWLAGVTGGVASTAGDITVRGFKWMAGASAGVASTSGAIAVLRTLAGVSSGVCSTAADLTNQKWLKGAIAGASVATGKVTALLSLAGVSAGIASVSATLGLNKYLAGVSAGAATATARLGRWSLAVRNKVAVRNLASIRNLPPE